MHSLSVFLNLDKETLLDQFYQLYSEHKKELKIEEGITPEMIHLYADKFKYNCIGLHGSNVFIRDQ